MDDSQQQATVDWSWGTVRYRLGSSDADDARDDDSESVVMYRGDVDESQQATVDWSWGTVRYRLGSSDADDARDEDDDDSESVSPPQSTDVQPSLHTSELQVRWALETG